jgi:predicted NUDIX family phosphoesterase
MKKILVTNAQWVNGANPRNTIIDGQRGQNIVDYINRNPIYKERSMMEENANYRQVIPYIVVEGKSDGRIVLMQRMPQQGEARLSGYHYFGVGGHTEYRDTGRGDDIIKVAALRELQEELGFSGGSLQLMGVIKMDDSEVDKVHLGILYNYITDEVKFNTNEMALHNPRWVTVHDIKAVYGNLEGWSRLVFDYYFNEA